MQVGVYLFWSMIRLLLKKGGKMEIEVMDANFKQEVLKSDLPCLVDFWAEWCAPCKMIAPIVKEIAEEYEGKLKVCKLNVDGNSETASKYEIMYIPMLLIFKKGKLVDKIMGFNSKTEVKTRIDRFIN